MFFFVISVIAFLRLWYSGNTKGNISGARVKVTLLSGPVSSKLPFWKTILLRKQIISPILFGVSKNGKKDSVLHNLSNPKIYKSQFFITKGGIANYFSKLFVDFRKVDVSPKIHGKFLLLNTQS